MDMDMEEDSEGSELDEIAREAKTGSQGQGQGQGPVMMEVDAEDLEAVYATLAEYEVALAAAQRENAEQQREIAELSAALVDQEDGPRGGGGDRGEDRGRDRDMGGGKGADSKEEKDGVQEDEAEDEDNILKILVSVV
jgi:hypothetical protein